MKRITEKKNGKKSIFIVENIIDGTVFGSKTVNVTTDTVTFKNHEYHLIYNSNYEVIEDAYNYLNHNQKRISANTKKSAVYALRYLYVFTRIISWEECASLKSL